MQGVWDTSLSVYQDSALDWESVHGQHKAVKNFMFKLVWTKLRISGQVENLNKAMYHFFFTGDSLFTENTGITGWAHAMFGRGKKAMKYSFSYNF